MKRRLVLAALMTLACVAQHAAAQGCSLTITTLNFGTYAGTQLNGTAAGTVVCGNAWTISFNAGTGAGATETVRKLTGPGGALLNYSLYTDAARTINWGNTTGNQCAQRAYWSNNSPTAGIIGDIPSESRLEPDQWGSATVE